MLRRVVFARFHSNVAKAIHSDLALLYAPDKVFLSTAWDVMESGVNWLAETEPVFIVG